MGETSGQGPMESLRASVRHGRQRRYTNLRAVMRGLLSLVLILCVSGATVVAYAYYDLTSKMQPAVQLVDAEGNKIEAPKPGAIEGSFSVLLVGSDSRKGQTLDDGETGELNDVNMLLTVSEDHTKATVVSYPRDLMVPIPSCPGPNGEPKYYPSMTRQPLNSALQYGGLSCVALTISKLSGVEIAYAGLVQFDGVIAVTEAIGGVEVCVGSDIDDRYTGLKLDAGMHTLVGADALAFLRSRHGVGDGGDLSRISNQQNFASELAKKVKSQNILGDGNKVYQLASAIAENVSLTESLNSLPMLMSLATTLKDIPIAEINFLQYPVKTDPSLPNKVVPDTASAKKMFAAIVAGDPLELTGGTGNATQLDAAELASGAATANGSVNGTATPKPGSTAKPGTAGQSGSTAAAGAGTAAAKATATPKPSASTKPGTSTTTGSSTAAASGAAAANGDDSAGAVIDGSGSVKLPNNVKGQNAQQTTCTVGRS